MSKGPDRRVRAEHLFRVISSKRFLNKQGLGNEVPFFICAFEVENGLSLGEDREDLIARLGHAGVRVLDIDLYDLTIKTLEDREIFSQILEMEAETNKAELKELLQGVLDPQSHLVPAIARRIEETPHDVIFLSGVGEVYPYLEGSKNPLVLRSAL
ncbi:BREX protein BrxB domain-containing protein [Asaia lannensis]|uniref:BREX protein BrxB domain-containing protein n=1 Tax=Asaia lannensis TaxID=415421 RepID=UPI003872CB0C